MRQARAQARRTSMTGWMLAVLAGTALVTAGCQSDSDEQTESSSDEQAESGEDETGSLELTGDDLCAMVPEAEVADVLGVEVESSAQNDIESQSFGRTAAQCEYELSGALGSVQTSVSILRDGEPQERVADKFVDAEDERADDYTEVADLGEAAGYGSAPNDVLDQNTKMLAVAAEIDGRSTILEVEAGDGPTQEALTAIADQILSGGEG